jgi:hypothetical protein
MCFGTMYAGSAFWHAARIEASSAPLSAAAMATMTDRLTELVVLDAERSHSPRVFVRVDHFLDLGRAHAIAGRLHHLVAAADEIEEAVFVHAYTVSPERPPSPE